MMTFDGMLDRLIAAANAGNPEEVEFWLRAIVADYQPERGGPEGAVPKTPPAPGGNGRAGKLIEPLLAMEVDEGMERGAAWK